MMRVVGIQSSKVWWYVALVTTGAVGLAGGFGIGVHQAAQGQAGTSGIGTSIVVDGLTRDYVVHLPAGHATLSGLPLLFAFHGGLGTDTGMNGLTQLDTVADSDGFAVVYPQGVDTSWNDGRGNTPAQRAGVDDVAFVNAMIDRFISLGANGNRIYATGISNGAMFTEFLGCKLAARLAGIAPVSGPMPSLDVPSCQPARPLQVLLIEGNADPIVPYGGGKVDGRDGGGTVISAPATAEFWRSVDGCTQNPPITHPASTVDDGTSVEASVATGCAAGSGVEFLTVVNGGHTWPGGWQYLPAVIVGKTSRQFGASAQLAVFFGLAPAPGAGASS